MTNRKKFRFIYFFSALYMTLMSLSAVLGNKLISTPYGILAGASLVSPFWFIIGDIITEVYGIDIIMSLFKSVVFCQFLFAATCLLVIKLPSPVGWQGQQGYELVCGHLLKIAIFQFIGTVLAWNVNVRLLTKWKILLKGKYFWLRSIGSSGLGLIVFSVASVFPTVYGDFPLNDVVSIVVWSCILKIVFTLVLAGPGNLIVLILKFYEKDDMFTDEPPYNPFVPDNSSIKFG